ncbi:carboxymuconolactone decarboxylase family protein [Actinomadura nitritigenes]|uniref:carboxymuconolactone decarboxylase family protein n=1 Tax=Actinomadura nitritigenes TaxID=134602 RepID=UPI0036C50529
MPKQSAPQELAQIAPKLVDVTNEVLFGDIWERPGLSARDRSLVTVSVLAALYRSEQLGYHLGVALDNGLSVEELSEAITHLAFYAGWPNAMTAITLLKKIADERSALPPTRAANRTRTISGRQ